MARKKKTRKQKILSDLRHHQPISHSENSVIDQPTPAVQTPRSSLFQYTVNTPMSATKTPTRNGVITDYHYLVKDLRKTAVLTAAIVIAQLVLFFLVNKHI